MYWLYGVGGLVLLAGYLLYDYYLSERPRKAKPKQLKPPKQPRSLKEVQQIQRIAWEADAELLEMDAHYRATSDPNWEGWGEPDRKSIRNFYRHPETNNIYVIEVNYYGSLVGSCGPLYIGMLKEHPHPEQYNCSSDQNNWVETNSENLYLVLFE